jgi:hypothetical protein
MSRGCWEVKETVPALLLLYESQSCSVPDDYRLPGNIGQEVATASLAQLKLAAAERVVADQAQ